MVFIREHSYFWDHTFEKVPENEKQPYTSNTFFHIFKCRAKNNETGLIALIFLKGEHRPIWIKKGLKNTLSRQLVSNINLVLRFTIQFSFWGAHLYAKLNVSSYFNLSDRLHKVALMKIRIWQNSKTKGELFLICATTFAMKKSRFSSWQNTSHVKY